MKKLVSLLTIGIMVACLLAFPASAANICPFDQPSAEELVPSLITTTVSVTGSCEGSTIFSEMNTWQLSGASSGISSLSSDLLTGIGITNIATESTFTSMGPSSIPVSVKAIDYKGTGAALSDTFYMSRISNGQDEGTAPLCEDVYGGGTVVFKSGMYGSELSGQVSPGAGIRVTYQNAGGPSQVAQLAPTAMIGTMTSFGKTHAIYGSLGNESVAVPELETHHETRASMSGKLNMGLSFSYDSFGPSS